MANLDPLLKRYKQGEVPRADMLTQLMGHTILVPSAAEIDAQGAGYEPLVFDRLGTPMVAAFSNTALAAKYQSSHPHLVPIKALGFVQALQPEFGLVLNPGDALSLELVPDLLARLRQQMGAF